MSVHFSGSNNSNELINNLKQNHGDLTIIGKGNQKIHTSLLNFVLSSYYLEDLILTATNDQPFEQVTIYLIDYDLKLVSVLLEYVSTGLANCENLEDFEEMSEMLKLLKIKSTLQSSNDVNDTIIKSEVILKDESISGSDSITDKANEQDQILEEPKIKLRQFRSVNECHICQYICTTDTELSSHFKIEHPNERPYACEYDNCMATFNHRQKLRGHIKQLHLRKSKKPHQPFKCQECYKCYSSQSKLDSHIKIYHSEIGPSLLEIYRKRCQEKSDNDENLQSSSEPEEGSEYEILEKKIQKHAKEKRCYICHELLKTDCQIVSHFRKHHPDNRPFNCKVCIKTFSLRHQQRHHMEAIHLKAAKKPPTAYKCHQCQTYLATQGGLNTHIQTYHVLPLVESIEIDQGNTTNGYEKLHPVNLTKINPIHSNPDGSTTASICNECGKSIENSELKSHLKLVHQIDTDLTCRECGKNFKTSLKLRRHLKITHNVITKKIEPQCPHCPRTFKSESAMLQHEVIHRAKSLVCEACGKRFRQKYNLNKHIRTLHNGLPKSIQCRICGQRFGNFKEQRIHAKIHSKG